MGDMKKSIKVLPAMHSLLNSIAEQEGFTKCAINITSISTNGANFMGDLFLVDVIENGMETLKLFAKATNVTEQTRAMLNINLLYRREVYIYTTIADMFHEFQDKHGVPLEKQFRFPKYYGSNMEQMEEVLILENLSSQGYIMYDRFKSIDWKYAKAAVEEIAKYHALSFALQKLEPEKFEDVVKKPIYGEYNLNLTAETYTLLMGQLVLQSASALKPEYSAKVQKFIDGDIFDYWVQQHQPLSQYSVLTHGDYRMSNILVKYKGDTVTSLKPVDYQTPFIGCPLNDLIYFIFTGSDEDFRREYYVKTVEHYFNMLTDFLGLLNLDIEEIYPRSTFYLELRGKLLFGLATALTVLSGVCLEASDTTTLEDLMEKGYTAPYTPNELYTSRLNGIVKDLIKWGYLQE